MLALKFIFRHFEKNKGQLSIAILGLVLGWSCFVSIGIFVYKELSYDQFHEKSERIYRVTHNEKAGEIPGTRNLATVGPPMGPALKETFAQVEDFVRFRYSPDWIVRNGENQQYENSVWYADPSVLTVFSFKLKEGNPSNALELPNNVVITSAMAKKYFGAEEALGKTLTMNQEEYKITGVLEPIPSNSHIKFDFLLPFQSFRVPYGYPVNLETWGWVSFHTYVLLQPGQDAKALQRQFPDLIKQHWEAERAKKFKLELQPLREIYFGDAKNDQIAAGNKTYLNALAISGLLILLVASFNFANLFTAIGISRAKEVGVRKLLGANRKHLSWKVKVESMFIVCISLIASLLVLPIWESYLPWSTPLTQLSVVDISGGVAALLFTSLIVGFLAGLYPAQLLVSYDFNKLLKGSFKVGKTGIMLRKGMLLSQFVVSVALLCSVIIISSQMNYLQTKDLGFKKDEILMLHVPGNELVTHFESLKSKLMQNPRVMDVSIGGGRMDGDTGNVPIVTETTDEDGEPMAIDAVTFDFFKTIGIALVAGREFTVAQHSDTTGGVIINLSAAKQFGWTPDEALGKKIRVGDIREGEVIGVVPDYNYASLHNAIKPLVVFYPASHLQDVYIRFNTKNPNELISSVTADWREVMPHLPLDYSFMSDHLLGLYGQDQNFSKMFLFFSILAIGIACLGLYGLISQDILYRVKEVGVRKVLGASTFGINGLLLKPFVILILIANLIAWPFTTFFMNRWLAEFTYHTAIDWFVFPLSALAVLIISVLSVSYLSIKAAVANPVESLRSE